MLFLKEDAIRKHKEKYALGIITPFPTLRHPFSPKGYVSLINDTSRKYTPFAGSVFEILIKVIDQNIDILWISNCD